MEKVNLFLTSVENELLDAFFKVSKDSLVAINNRQGGWAVEITRDVAIQLLNTVMIAAMRNGLAVKIDTTSDLVSGRFITKCTLVIMDDGREVMNLSAFGEGMDTGVTKTGEQYVNDNALRASETRAIKRVIEYITPVIGRTLKYISVQVQKFITLNAGVTITYSMLNNVINSVLDNLHKQYISKKSTGSDNLASESPQPVIQSEIPKQNDAKQATEATEKELAGLVKNVKRYNSKQISQSSQVASQTTTESFITPEGSLAINDGDLENILNA